MDWVGREREKERRKERGGRERRKERFAEPLLCP